MSGPLLLIFGLLIIPAAAGLWRLQGVSNPLQPPMADVLSTAPTGRTIPVRAAAMMVAATGLSLIMLFFLGF